MDIVWYPCLKGGLIKFDHYTSKGIIVRREVHGRHSYAEMNVQQLYKLLHEDDVLTGKTSYHEICYVTGTAKPRFDIEGKFTEKSYADETRDFILAELEKLLRSCIDAKFKFMVYDSSGYMGSVNAMYKMSVHVVCDGVHYNVVRQCDQFCKQVVSLMPETTRQYIDTAIYGMNHSLRVLGCCKESRRKTLLGGEDFTLADLAASLVTYSRQSQTINSITAHQEVDRSHVELPEEVADMVMEHIPAEFKYRDAVTYERNGSTVYDVNLTRLQPSHCNICNRVHEKDNTLIIMATVDKINGICISYRCRRQSQSINISRAKAQNNPQVNIVSIMSQVHRF